MKTDIYSAQECHLPSSVDFWLYTIVTALFVLAPSSAFAQDSEEEYLKLIELGSAEVEDIAGTFAFRACSSNESLRPQWHLVTDEADGDVSVYSKISPAGLSYEGHFTKEEWKTVETARREAANYQECVVDFSSVSDTRLTPLWPFFPGGAQVSSASGGGGAYTATRLFAGPDEYPPSDFQAYGILAFPSTITPFNKTRHFVFCYAYLASLLEANSVDIPKSSQMVTVWPLEESIQEDLEDLDQEGVCNLATRTYGHDTAANALQEARSAGYDVSNIGPYLLAWSPADEKGKDSAVVLYMDLSSTTTFVDAQRQIVKWRNDIESKPELWEKGWNMEKLLAVIRNWADNTGTLLFGDFIQKHG